MRHWVAVVLLVLGVVGVASGYPPRVTPTPVDVTWNGAYTSPGSFLITEAGEYTVWEAGTTRHDGNRCDVFRVDGTKVAVSGPGLPIRWNTDGDAVDIWTVMGTFRTDEGGHIIRCVLDPATPGTSFVVSSKPDIALSLAALIGGAVLILAALVVGVLVGWRR